MPPLTDPPERLEVLAIAGLPEITAGTPLVQELCRAVSSAGLAFEDGDVLVLAQKIVSKAEGRLIELSGIEPSAFALSLAATLGKDARHIEVVLRESKRIVRMDAGLIVAETHHGLTCANAGVDTSNVPEGWVALLPADPDASARRLQEEISRCTGKQIALIISDTFGRPWREGLTNVAIGVAGFNPLLDYRGHEDGHGHSLSATVIAAADELAAAAEIVMGKLSHRPAAIIRHFPWRPAPGNATALIRARERDLFR
ncbi:MAG: coenzyme F420-0:L-glutamate ligase [Acidobacteria bacterium]|nr:coenzyme F420-0:L-glutamate ligase [Acidobacteriota bacterium]